MADKFNQLCLGGGKHDPIDDLKGAVTTFQQVATEQQCAEAEAAHQ